MTTTKRISIPSHLPCLKAIRPMPAAARNGAQFLRDQKVEDCMPIVKRLARRVGRQINDNVSRDELIAWGVTGLLEAIDRFIPGGEASLETFAYYRIQGAMLDGIGKIAPLSKRCYRSAKSIGDNHAIYPDKVPSDEIIDPHGRDAETLASDHELYKLLEDAISSLSETQQYLIRQYYFEDRTFVEAGRDLGISKSWASRAHASALEKLQEQLGREESFAA